MTLKSKSFKVAESDAKTLDQSKVRLETRHKGEIDKVVSDARSLAEDRRAALNRITNPALRERASR